MKLHTYTNDIIDIASANKMAWSIGADMFLANVKNAGDPELPYYEGADRVDYAALKPHVAELQDSQGRWVKDYHNHNKEIIALRKEGKYDEVTALMEAAGEEKTDGDGK